MSAGIKSLIVASHNRGKVREIGALLAPLGIETVSAGDLGLPEPDETESTFAGNAALKARAAWAASGGRAVLADDSGLEAHGLGGAPGIFSARWAGPDKNFRLAMQRVHEALAAARSTDLSARFVCALALMTDASGPEVFEGTVSGELVWPPRGEKGFGYDPMFRPDGHARTFGEMAPEEKEPLTHRARAFEKLVSRLR